jgi:hypothetical protein
MHESGSGTQRPVFEPLSCMPRILGLADPDAIRSAATGVFAPPAQPTPPPAVYPPPPAQSDPVVESEKSIECCGRAPELEPHGKPRREFRSTCIREFRELSKP